MVKVGNSECEFLKLTPLSRTSAIAGAVCGVTMRPRNPSGTNRIRLRGAAFCADAALAVSVIRLADSNTIVRRISLFPIGSDSGDPPLPRFSFAMRQDCYIGAHWPQERGGGPSKSRSRAASCRETLRPDAVFPSRRPAMSKFREKAEA